MADIATRVPEVGHLTLVACVKTNEMHVLGRRIIGCIIIMHNDDELHNFIRGKYNIHMEIQWLVASIHNTYDVVNKERKEIL